MALFFPMSAQRRLWMHMGRLWMHMDGGESEEKTQKASPLTCQMTRKAGDARSKQKSRLKEFSQSRCKVFVFMSFMWWNRRWDAYVETSSTHLPHKFSRKLMQSLQNPTRFFLSALQIYELLGENTKYILQNRENFWQIFYKQTKNHSKRVKSVRSQNFFLAISSTAMKGAFHKKQASHLPPSTSHSHHADRKKKRKKMSRNLVLTEK